MNIDIIGEIGGEITTETVRAQLAAAKGQPICCRFFSEGGSVFEGFAISNLLREYRGVKTAIVDAAFSIASYILACGRFNKITMSENGFLMLHCPYSENETPKPSETKLLGSLRDQIAQGYVEKSGKPLATIQRLMADETFLNATECIRWGFADSVCSSGQAMAISARLRDKMQARLAIGKTPIEKWKSLVKIHGAIKANRIDPELRLRVMRGEN